MSSDDITVTRRDPELIEGHVMTVFSDGTSVLLTRAQDDALFTLHSNFVANLVKKVR
jgi:hypothetical protein